MGEFGEFKRAFYKEAIAHGIAEKSQIKLAFPLGYTVPEKKVISWLDKLKKLPKFSGQRRYVNRFKLGADPEFVFISGRKGAIEEEERRVDAHQLGLKQGLAFGADNNGRLTEIRPHPSRSALKVCASVMSTLRWMALCYPDLLGMQWRAGAFIHGDGIGGHVHFGRKRPNRRVEVAALDVISEMLLSLGVYPARETQMRRGGDRLHQLYGLPGDFRLQTHGYEYRTFPSWLDSPALAFITLTLAKLTVHNPELLLSFPLSGPITLQTQRLKNLLAYYKDTDDDALLACYMLTKGAIPKHTGGDFKDNWGADVKRPISELIIPTMIPMSIEASVQDTDEMFEHLLNGTALKPRVPTPTWTPSNPPRGYYMVIGRTNTLGMKGLGEMIWDICAADGCKIDIWGSPRGGYPITVSRKLANLLPVNWRKKLGAGIDARVTDDLSGHSMQISIEWREGARARRMKDILLGGVFPLWKVHNLPTYALKEWTEARGDIRKTEQWKSQVIYKEGNIQ